MSSQTIRFLEILKNETDVIGINRTFVISLVRTHGIEFSLYLFSIFLSTVSLVEQHFTKTGLDQHFGWVPSLTNLWGLAVNRNINLFFCMCRNRDRSSLLLIIIYERGVGNKPNKFIFYEFSNILYNYIVHSNILALYASHENITNIKIQIPCTIAMNTTSYFRL